MGRILKIIILCITLVHFSTDCSFSFQTISSDLIIDLSTLLKHSLRNDEQSKQASETIIDTIRTRSNGTVQLAMYYDTELALELREELQKLMLKLNELIYRHNTHMPKIWLSIRDDDFNLKSESITQRVQKYYKDAIKVLLDNKSVVAGVAFYGLAVDNKCYQRGSRFVTDISNVSIISEIRKLSITDLHDNTIPKLGYVLDHKLLTCKNYIYNKKDADFNIISINLQRYDKLFIESYSLFKENINNEIMSKMNDDLVNSTVLFRVHFDTRVQRSTFGYYTTNDKGSAYFVDIIEQKLLDSTFSPLNLRDGITDQRYADLLVTYLQNWKTEYGIENKIILNYPNIKYSDAIVNPANFLLIPDLSHPFNILINSRAQLNKYNKARNPSTQKSIIDMFLREIAASGYSTYRTLGRTWRNLTEFNDNNFSYCENVTICRPTNVMYLNDEIYPKPEQVQEIVGMRVDIVALSYHLDPSHHKYIWADLKKSFNIGSNNSFSLACQIWGKSDKTRHCNNENTCKAIDVVLAHNNICESLKSIYSHIIWIEIIDFEDWKRQDYLIQNFVDSVMKKLDSLVVAREVIHNEFPAKEIYIEISPNYLGNESSSDKTTLFCNTKAERIGQFYEAILTWAKIHDFPVIIQPWYKEYHLEIPISWEQLQSNSSRLLQDLMKNTPVFIRRSYNQSIVIGSWTKGMYPCLIQSSKELVNQSRIKFDEKVSVTLNLELRSNITKTAEELQILLLFSLGTFSSINIPITQQHQLHKLYNILASSNFEENLKINKISRKVIYFAVPQNCSRIFIEILNKVIFKLRDLQFKTHVHANSFQCLNRLLTGTRIGLVINSCEKLLKAFLFEDSTQKQSISSTTADLWKVSYIVCETDWVHAHTKSKKTLQDFLNSHLYLKKMYQYYFTNIKNIHFHLHPRRAGSNEADQVENLLMFLSDLTNYAKGYDINYFLIPAFSQENNVERMSSFWKIRNYTNLTDLSIYLEYQAEYLGETTWVPTIDLNYKHSNNKSFMTSETVNILLGVVSFAGMLGIFFAIWILRTNKRKLTVKDVKRFRSGQRETIRKAVTERQNNQYTLNIFDGLVFQNEFEIDKKELTLNKKVILGKGKLSIVFPGMIPAIQETVAVKVANQSCSKKSIIYMLSEIKLLCYLGDHVNTLRFIGCYTKEIEKGVLWVVTELCEGGSLFAYLKSKNDIDPKELIRFAHEIACGMEYISNQKVIHGNLGTKSVLLDQSTTCKVFGYGKLGRKIDHLQKCLKNEKEPFNWQWLAFESLKSVEFSMKTDVWSFGTTVWEIFNPTNVPYEDTCWNINFVSSLETGYRLLKPQSASDEIYNVLLKCWNISPKDRPDFSMLVDAFVKL